MRHRLEALVITNIAHHHKNYFLAILAAFAIIALYRANRDDKGAGEMFNVSGNELEVYRAEECLRACNAKNLDYAEECLRRRFPQYMVYRGGHHVAVINKANDERLVLVTE